MRRIALDTQANPVVKYSEIHAALGRSKSLHGIRNGGDHTVYTGPHGSVPVPNHAGHDCPRGTWRSICRMAIAAGLAALVVAVAVSMLV